MATCLEIIQHIDEQWNDLVRVRSAFPTMTRDAIGAQSFDTAPYYQRQGHHVRISFPEPVTQETINRINQIGAWINESYVIRLYTLLEYNKIIPQKKEGGLDQSLDGFDDIYILRRLRNQIVHHAGLYNCEDKDSRKLYESMVKRFSLPPASPTPQGRYLVHIDRFLQPLTEGCKRYTEAVFQRDSSPRQSVV